jgi:hypothetical protein
MAILALGFVVFCIGGTLFMKGGVDRSPGDVHSAVPLAVHALNTSGIALMAVGGLLMMSASII